jgi:hypothetical protein
LLSQILQAHPGAHEPGKEAILKLIHHPKYTPEKLLDAVMARCGLKNDAALARLLDYMPPVISRLRNKKVPVGASVMLRIHEAADEMPFAEMRQLMGVPVVGRVPVEV